jgi:hypothetical protein
MSTFGAAIDTSAGILLTAFVYGKGYWMSLMSLKLGYLGC